MSSDTKTESKQKHEVTRDPASQRLSADRALAYFLGRDVELVFMMEMQRLFHTETGTGDNYASEPAGLSEFLRLRLPPGAATLLALDILQELAPTGGIRRDNFESAMDRILSDVRRADEERQKDDDATSAQS